MFVHPLIALERHEVALEPALVTEARRELLSGAEGTFRHGYLLGVHAEAGTHPACVELAAGVRERLLDDTFALSFMKLAVGTPPVSADAERSAGALPAVVRGRDG